MKEISNEVADSNKNDEIRVEGRENPNNRNEYVISNLLLCLESFHKSIHHLQSSIGHRVKEKLNESEKSKLDAGVSAILDRFSLTINWKPSITGAVFTNFLKVPNQLESLHFHLPKKYSNLETEDDYRQALIELTHPLDSRELFTHPAISFKYRISVSKLKKWMTANKKLLQESLSKLPDKPKTKLTVKTIILGQLAAIKMQEGKHKFSEIRKAIDKEVNSNERLQDIFAGNLGEPSEDDLRNAYRALMKSLSDLFPERKSP